MDKGKSAIDKKAGHKKVTLRKTCKTYIHGG